MKNKEFVSFKIIIERLKILLNKQNDSDIAKYLQLTYNSFAQNKRRNTTPYYNILFLCRQKKISVLKLLDIDNKVFEKYINKFQYKSFKKIKNNGNEIVIKIKKNIFTL